MKDLQSFGVESVNVSDGTGIFEKSTEFKFKVEKEYISLDGLQEKVINILNLTSDIDANKIAMLKLGRELSKMKKDNIISDYRLRRCDSQKYYLWYVYPKIATTTESVKK